ncbi:oxidoreductase [Ereboglobus luteus]|uniref:Oxidoreductase n=2 Tax=Ereboglobus luteus TaxID=1796921 RepID=A0A2U8E4H3_9BACT|nr:oxidoreductase [Ereboglobus luteus]
MNRRGFLAASAGVLAVGALSETILRAAPASAPDGMQYAPRQAMPKSVVKPGEFVIAASHLDHGHIYAQCKALIDAGATLKWVYEPDEKKRAAFLKRHPGLKVARAYDEILDDPEVRLVTTAAIPCERGPLACRAMEAGKDYFTDKPPFTTLTQLAQARETAARTGRKYMVYYSGRIHSEAGVFATGLVRDGAIGRVLQVICLAPHRLNAAKRPRWFFEREKYGGILCDLGSHQFEQFLAYTGADDATVSASAVANFNNPDHPGLEDFGEALAIAPNGASLYTRVDWFTPAGLGAWGDGRVFILGTKGTIELRGYIDVARERTENHVYIVDEKNERHLNVTGQTGFPFFGQLILDCLNRTENAMTQTRAFKAAELSLAAQAAARRLA